MRPGIFLSIVEFTPGDTRPRESAWVLETDWRCGRRQAAARGPSVRPQRLPGYDSPTGRSRPQRVHHLAGFGRAP